MRARTDFPGNARPVVPIGILAFGSLLALLPLLRVAAFYESLLYLVFYWVVLATSWNILSGFAGYFSFGHGAFFGVGVYTTAVLAGKFNWPFLLTIPVAGLLAALIAVLIGAVVFRVKGVRGELFALLTLAVTFVLATIVLNTPIDGGPGVYLNAVPLPAIGPSPSATFYLLMLTAAILTLLISWRIHSSKFGSGLFAIHDDEDAAEVLGVPTFQLKLIALALSSGLAGIAGGIHAMFISYVTATEVFSITVPLTVVLMSVLGGTRHWAGPAVGAATITALLYAFTAGDSAIIGKAVTGAILVAAILFMPEGILDKLLRLRSPSKARSAVPETGVESSQASLHHLGSHAIQPIVAAPRVPLLKARGLSKHFAGLRALDEVNVDVYRGEILALLGPNGSGKSTFINVISGHYSPSAGTVTLHERAITGLAAHHIAQAGIARTYQIPRPFKHLNVLNNVAVAAMFGSTGLANRHAGYARARECLAFTGLAGKAEAMPDDLNLHQRKFLELARALASRPALIMLDEVLCGLTPAEIQEAVAMIRRIRDQGTTVIFVEHVMDAVIALADRAVVFNEGRVLAEGAVKDVMQRPEVMRAYLGSEVAVLAPGMSTLQAAQQHA
jgi:branched-chain amino acid transport system permease protein